VKLAFAVTLQEGHMTLVSHETKSNVLKMALTTAEEDIYTLSLPQSGSVKLGAPSSKKALRKHPYRKDINLTSVYQVAKSERI